MAKTIAEIIQDNDWKSTSFLESTAVNRLYTSGILANASDSAKALLNAMQEDNVQSVFKVGLVDYEWAEQNFGDASDNLAGALEPAFEELDVKTFYGNMWWAIRQIQKDLASSTKPNQLVLQKIGIYWATQLNKIISATISGMSDIAEITVGTGLANFSNALVLQVRKKKGDMGFGKLAKMYMNSVTMFDILEKQEDGTIAKELITERYGLITKVVDGIEQTVQSDVPSYVYNGVTEIVVDDDMKDGIISLVEAGAFAFQMKDLSSPLMYTDSPKAGNGVGKEEWGTKMLYICHPVGFGFVGGLAGAGGKTPYAKKSGLSIAELQGGGLYALVVDSKLSMIQNLKVKIGA